uniref:HMG box domain-containing protein n=1 Tax=Elaeophora elaphi TaxID=1147741 RepID=A0A0R3RL75_9BILA
MYHHPTSLYHSAVSSCTDNSCIDFGIYGIEQNDCCLDLNCIEPSLVPEEQQVYTYTTAQYSSRNGSINATVIDGTDQVTSRTSRRTIRKKRSKKDPNEPQKPVSAYALFFRDTQAAIKGRSPNVSFGEVSKIVASMWDSLDCYAKNLYKQRTETAKKDYLKELATYRAQQISRNETVQPVLVSERGASSAMKTINSASSSSLKQGVSDAISEMTLANLIARPPSANFSSFYLNQCTSFYFSVSSTFNDVNQHPTLIHQHSTSDFHSIPLIIEVVGIITTVAACLLMHCALKKSCENTDRPTFHHLIHDQYYTKQLDEFLNEQDGKNETVRDPFPNIVKPIREHFCTLKANIRNFLIIFSSQNFEII